MTEYEAEDGWTEEDAFEAVVDEFQADPQTVAQALIAEAVADQAAVLQPAVNEVLNAHRARFWQANTDEAVKEMDRLYGEAWREPVSAYVAEHQDLISDQVIADPQALAERLQGIWRTVRPSVVAEQQSGAWEAIKTAEVADWAGTRARAGQ